MDKVSEILGIVYTYHVVVMLTVNLNYANPPRGGGRSENKKTKHFNGEITTSERQCF